VHVLRNVRWRSEPLDYSEEKETTSITSAGNYTAKRQSYLTFFDAPRRATDILDSYIQNGKAGLDDWLAYLRVCVNNDA